MPIERFLILTRQSNPSALNLQRLLAPLGKTELIVDHPQARGNWYPDHLLQEYKHIMGMGSFPLLTAWSRAFFHLEQTLQAHEAIWFVEEDVAGNFSAFKGLVEATHLANPDLAASEIYSCQEFPHWPWWRLNANWFVQPWKSFNPLSRLSARLVHEVLKLRAAKQRFTFHELMFASIAMQARMRVLDWQIYPEFRSYFGAFRWRPLVKIPNHGISHPVKDMLCHTKICDLDA